MNFSDNLTNILPSNFVPLPRLPASFDHLGVELPSALLALLVPTVLLYGSIYMHVKGFHRTYVLLTLTSIASFVAYPYVTPIHCGPFRSLQYFATAIGSMKLLDILARQNSLPTYTASKTRPADWLFALIVMTELRYESFTPNHIRVARFAENLSEPSQLLLHMAFFVALQAMPQRHPMILALEVLLSIYILWTSIQMVLRYKTSPSLFGPLYLADSLSGFWSETWHNAFASPCESLAYRPLRYGLASLGAPVKVARSAGILGAFGLMAVFHMYTLQPVLPRQGLNRVGLFFFLNGVGTVVEGAIWGRRRHWLKAVLAWTFEMVVATWTAKAANIPNGLSQIPWLDVCGPVETY